MKKLSDLPIGCYIGREEFYTSEGEKTFWRLITPLMNHKGILYEGDEQSALNYFVELIEKKKWG